jgi:hypothetical protein
MGMLEGILTLSNDNLTIKNKIVFTAVLIFLVTVIAYLMQQYFFQSYRNSLTPVDLLVSTSSKFYYYESFYQEQIEVMSSSIL